MFKKIFLLLIFLLSVGGAFSFDIPKYDGYVTDIANVLTTAEETELENRIYEVWQKTNTEIGVLIIPSLEGDAAFSVAVDVGNTRGVGDKRYDNGILILIAIEDREWFNAVGYGLEGTIPDAIAKRIGEENYVPNFREGMYFEGIYNGVVDMYNYIIADPDTLRYYEENPISSTSDEAGFLEKFLLFYFIISIFFSKLILAKDSFVGGRARKIALSYLGYAGFFGSIGGLVTGLWMDAFLMAFGVLLMASLAGYLNLHVLFLNGMFSGGGSGGGGGGSSFGGFGGGSFGGGGGGGSR